MGRTTTNISRAPFVVDPQSITRNSGRQIDWDNVADSYRVGAVVATTTAAAAYNATSIAVSALSAGIPINTQLNFGTWAPVAATVGVAGAAQGATSVPVAALSGPIPSGTVLDFATNKFARLTAAAAAGATSLTVAALPTALVSGDVATFSGGTKSARLTAAAAAAATSLTVDELPLPIASGDSATSPGEGLKTLRAGTVVGELLGGGKVSPRVATTNPATGILETTAVYGEKVAALSGYGVITGGVLYENMLPEATGSPKVLATAVKTELNANGTGFAFEQYGDSRT